MGLRFDRAVCALAAASCEAITGVFSGMLVVFGWLVVACELFDASARLWI